MLEHILQPKQSKVLLEGFCLNMSSYCLPTKAIVPPIVPSVLLQKRLLPKALGTGIGKIVSFQDLTVRNNDSGKPYFIPSEKLRLYLLGKNIKHAHLSLSDEKYNAVAFVVLELGVEDQNDSGEYNTTF